MPPLHLGIDLGATALRAAWTRGDAPGHHRTLDGNGWPLPLPSAGAALDFPTLKEALATGANLRFPNAAKSGATPHERVVAALQTVRTWADPAGQAEGISTAFAVPARYDSRTRTALRSAAAAAGLTRVRMVGDATAATAARTEGSGKATTLILSLGYSGCETSVIRSTRGVYRTLAQESFLQPSARSLAARLLQHALATLQHEGGDPAALLQDPHRTRSMVRAIAHIQTKHTRKGLSTGRSYREARQLLLSHPGLLAEYDVHLAACAKTVSERLSRVLDEASVRVQDVTEILLVGGLSHHPRIQEAVAALGPPLHLLATDALAEGARLLAAPSRDGSLPEDEDPVPLAHQPEEDAPGPAPSPYLDPLATARTLAAEHRTHEARALLEDLIAGARSLLAELPPDTPPPTPPRSRPRPSPPAPRPSRPDDSPQALARAAWRLLEEGRHEDAVRHAHRLHQAYPRDAELHRSLVDIHCAAAEAADRPEQFEEAIRWLSCAVSLTHGLEPRVKELAAVRCHAQGKRLSREGRRQEALAALDQALDWDPEHEPSRRLRSRLQGGR